VSVRFAVRLTPRGGREAVDGVGEDGLLRCRVAAPPLEGAANAALVRLLASELGVSRGAVAIVGGASARVKQVAVEGVSAEALSARWPGLAARV
jgi:uncharacterized protein YggU (UPF0235/DUF167 family)